jgi:hypothetical protein
MARTPSVNKVTTERKAASAKEKSPTTTTKAWKKKSKVADVVELTASEDKGKGAIKHGYVCSSSPGA